MITLLKSGTYRLIETRRHIKILYLDGESFAWLAPINIGEILVVSHNAHKTDCVLSEGRYRIYAVKDESDLTDQTHMELEYAPDKWQGYLLLSGLPGISKQRGRIIPTVETITNKGAVTASII